MTQEDLTEAYEEVIRKAINNEHTQFRLLTNYTFFQQAKEHIRSLKKVIRIFKVTVKKAKKELIQQAKLMVTTQATIAASIKALLVTIDFYTEELKIVQDMIMEYRCYLLAGNFIKSWFFGQERAEEDLIDYRFDKK